MVFAGQADSIPDVYYFKDPDIMKSGDLSRMAYIAPKEGMSESEWNTFLQGLIEGAAYSMDYIKDKVDVYYVSDNIEGFDPTKEYTNREQSVQIALNSTIENLTTNFSKWREEQAKVASTRNQSSSENSGQTGTQGSSESSRQTKNPAGGTYQYSPPSLIEPNGVVYIDDLDYLEEAYNKYPNAKFQSRGFPQEYLNAEKAKLVEKKKAEEEAAKRQEAERELANAGGRGSTKNPAGGTYQYSPPSLIEPNGVVYIDDLDYLEEAYNKYPNARFQSRGFPQAYVNAKKAELEAKKAREARRAAEEVAAQKEKAEATMTVGTEEGEPDIINIRETVKVADNFLKNGSEGQEDKNISSGIDQNMMRKTVNSLNKVLITVGIVIAIIVGLILGIKFVIGGIEEKAEIKGMLVPYVLGIVVLFAAYAIWSLVVNLLQNNI